MCKQNINKELSKISGLDENKNVSPCGQKITFYSAEDLRLFVRCLSNNDVIDVDCREHH